MALILAYSFIIGRKQTMKIIIATYIAFLASDGLSYFLKNTIGFSVPAKIFGFSQPNAAILVAILLFIIFIVIMARHHAYDVNIEDGVADAKYMITTSFAAVLSAILIVSCVLFYLSGNTMTVLDEHVSKSSILAVARQSEIAKAMVDYFYVSFFMPAISLIAVSFLGK